MKQRKLVLILVGIVAVGLSRGGREAVSGGPPAAVAPPAPTAAPDVTGPTFTLDLGSQVTMRLMLIPAGTFRMGSPDDEADRAKDEGPQREVAISKPFYLGVHEVTQQQYEQVIGKNPSRHKGPENPVESVTWSEAAEFCRKVSDLAGRTVRLPTEAEWEYACRAGAHGRFSFGADEKALDDHAWYAGNSGKKPHPVAGKKPNRFGLHDMHGNVFEWCADWHGAYGGAAGVDPRGPESGKARVVRGSGFFGKPDQLRSATRFKGPPTCRACHIGFRVAADAEAPAGPK